MYDGEVTFLPSSEKENHPRDGTRCRAGCVPDTSGKLGLWVGGWEGAPDPWELNSKTSKNSACGNDQHKGGGEICG